MIQRYIRGILSIDIPVDKEGLSFMSVRFISSTDTKALNVNACLFLNKTLKQLIWVFSVDFTNSRGVQ